MSIHSVVNCDEDCVRTENTKLKQDEKINSKCLHVIKEIIRKTNYFLFFHVLLGVLNLPVWSWKSWRWSVDAKEPSLVSIWRYMDWYCWGLDVLCYFSTTKLKWKSLTFQTGQVALDTKPVPFLKTISLFCEILNPGAPCSHKEKELSPGQKCLFTGPYIYSFILSTIKSDLTSIWWKKILFYFM